MGFGFGFLGFGVFGVQRLRIGVSGVSRLGPILEPARQLRKYLVAGWIHVTLLGIISPTIKLKVYTLGGL